MEAIILFAVIAIASTVFQSIGQNMKKRDEQAFPKPPEQKPQVQQTTKPVNHSRPASTTVKKRATVIKPAVQAPTPLELHVHDEESVRILEGAPLDNEINARTQEQNVRMANSDSGISIGLEDVQRSVIMAEILGKPRALKKSIR